MQHNPQHLHALDTTVSRQRDHVETEEDRTEVETVGESTDVSEGAGGEEKAGKGYGSTGEKDGTKESVGKQQKMHSR